MDKIVFRDEFIPRKEDAVRSILDYAINIFPLAEEEKQVIMTTREFLTEFEFPVHSSQHELQCGRLPGRLPCYQL